MPLEQAGGDAVNMSQGTRPSGNEGRGKELGLKGDRALGPLPIRHRLQVRMFVGARVTTCLLLPWSVS